MSRRVNWLLALLIGVTFPNLYAQRGYAPPCDEVKQIDIAPGSIKKSIISKFIQECERNWWKTDKGIIHLAEYKNEQGKLCWLLQQRIDDSYKDNPPDQFADFDGDIILIFEADSNRNIIPTKKNRDALNRCLEQIVGDRVYIRPTIKTRWTSSVLPITNKKLKVGRRRIRGGNGGSLIIIFNADGSFEQLLPV